MSTSKTLILASVLLAIVIIGGNIVASSTFNLGTPDEADGATAIPQSGLKRFFNDPFSIFSRLKDNKASGEPSLKRASNELLLDGVSRERLSEESKMVRQQLIRSPIRDRNGDRILTENDSWSIIYVPTGDDFLSFIFQDPADTAKKEVERWFEERGIPRSDLCDLPLRFLLTTEELRRTNFNFTSLPNGCE